MTEPSHAVFVSYASQDAQAAQRIAQALRSSGIEVWFDQSELRGGDVWDQSIRRQIRTCALFIPIVSRHTHERAEGYFRLEWKLAVDRSHLMSANKAFLLPVVIDDTGNDDEHVPDKFREVQWTRLPDGETPPAFVDRVRRLLSPETPTAAATVGGARAGAAQISPAPAQAAWSPKRGLLAALVIAVAGVMAYVAIEKIQIAKPAAPAPAPAPAAAAAPAAFTPPPHSIAVLPFINMSGDKEQQYFSDGLTEELLNSLSRIEQLQVAAPTSSFSFQGEHPDIATVARKLNVGAVLEGSVRRAGHTVRITAQLINAVTGFHLWSQTYDRDLKDVLRVQTEIATAVASALKVTLLGNEAAKIELGGTHDPGAFDAYLRASKALRAGQGTVSYESAIAGYTEAIRLDPSYALAFAGRSLALSSYAGDFANDTGIRELRAKAEADARRALKLAPELAEGYVALGLHLSSTLDFVHASEAYQRAMALASGDADVLARSGTLAAILGRFDAGLAAVRHAVALDPLNPQTHEALGESLFWARRYQEAIAAFGEVTSLEPDFKRAYGFRGIAYYWLGDLQSARSSCETRPDHWSSIWCLSLTYEKLGRHADAEAQLKKFQAAFGDAAAYQSATIYAQWGDTAKALEWLGRAVRLPDGGVRYVKVDPLLDPLRQDPRFQAIERELKFPD